MVTWNSLWDTSSCQKPGHDCHSPSSLFSKKGMVQINHIYVCMYVYVYIYIYIYKLRTNYSHQSGMINRCKIREKQGGILVNISTLKCTMQQLQVQLLITMHCTVTYQRLHLLLHNELLKSQFWVHVYVSTVEIVVVAHCMFIVFTGSMVLTGVCVCVYIYIYIYIYIEREREIYVTWLCLLLREPYRFYCEDYILS